MALKWKITVLKPQQTLKKFALDAWANSIPELEKWIRTDLIKAMVFGGMNIQGIAQTDFYKFISSDDGLSQLGIEKSEPPKLLKVYEQSSFKTRSGKTFVELSFGDTAKLRAGTPHPANGTGQLKVDSWLEWVFDQSTVSRGYVPRGDIPGKMQKSIRLGSPLGGLMLVRNALGKSSGTWNFPPSLTHYDEKWFDHNIDKIQKALTDKAFEIFARKLNG